MSTSSRHRASSPPSSSSVNRSSVRSYKRLPPPATTVVTSPPWARDEPPSPKDHPALLSDGLNVMESHPSDAGSFQTNISQAGSRWWTFALPRPRDQPFEFITSPNHRPERKVFKELSMSWLPTAASLREGASFGRREKGKDPELAETLGGEKDHLSITLPTEPPVPFTLSHNATPGWDTPWTSRPNAQGPFRDPNRQESYGFAEAETESFEKDTNAWRRRKRRFRSFIMTNTYVPLFFRFINIAFTVAALAMAIEIRKIETRNNARGAVGSSPTVVIIFAPLTLVHVMFAIYLEYFGRPLGLWRTSAKLAHTLSEVLFICAWSAALSLSFDNFFTSLIPCASPSARSWYNELPRPTNGLPTFEDSLGDYLCDHQLTLICLVGIGLIAYCTNLVISLFRIFEKVKSHPQSVFRSS